MKVAVCVRLIVNVPSAELLPVQLPVIEPTTNGLPSLTVPPLPSETVTVAVPSPPLEKIICPDEPVAAFPARFHEYESGSLSGSDADTEYANDVMFAMPKFGLIESELITGARFCWVGGVGVVGVVGVLLLPPPHAPRMRTAAIIAKRLTVPP
jgi:hypothetical protein